MNATTETLVFRATLGRAAFRILFPVVAFALCAAAVTSLSAQDRGRRGGDSSGGGDRGSFNPADMQARMLTALRERFDVPNDDEWAVIADRLTKVAELRRASGGGFGGFALAGRGGDSSGRGGSTGGASRSRSSSGGATDVAALQAAVTDKLPDAEIKARLDRVRELRKENEAKLAKAQEELRAVLSVRQEAIAVLAGLLP